MLKHASGSFNYINEPIALSVLLISLTVVFLLIYLVGGNFLKQNASNCLSKTGGKVRCMKKSLRNSLKNKELQVVYQPIVSLTSESISLESLVRWKYKDEWVPPIVFIPLIEDMGLIEELTRQVANKVMQDWNFWKDEIPQLTHISLNISPLMLQSNEPSSFLEELLEELETRRINPKQICLEITENVLLDHRSLKFIEDCTINGLLIAIDDFGTGYSSMSYIANYPFDVLKIDRSFVEQIEKNRKQQEVAYAIVQLAKRLDIQVVAEGVETEEQLNILRLMGTDAVQGYYFSKPQFVNEWNPYHLNKKLSLLRV